MIAHRSLPPAPESVAVARQFVAETLTDLPGQTVDELVLMVSELATNCVLHAHTGFRIAVERSQQQVRIEVTDDGPGQAQPRRPAVSDPHGRGLQIVNTLSQEWGVIPASDGTGKTVWLTLALPG